jgi:hypothetical protein
MSTIAAGNTLTTGFVSTSDTTGNLVFQTNGTTTALTLTTGQNANVVGSVSALNTFGFENRIINGGMTIDQRNAGASVTPTQGAYTLDRWQSLLTAASKFSIQQNAGSVTPPVGFSNYLGITSLSAYSVSASDYFGVAQGIEGFNWADLAWGTANAKTATLSFWVRSSLTGTFGGSFYNSAFNYSYPFNYSISAANTWEQKSITVIGPTSGTWLGATNGTGAKVEFSLGAGATYSSTAGTWVGASYLSATGATSVVGTNGATWYITGVQFEVGSQATNFDFRSYGTELELCQRYFVGSNTYYFTQGYDAAYTSLNSGGLAWTYQMRTTPTVTILSGGAEGHHAVAPTVRSGPSYYGVGLQFTGSGLRTNANGTAYVALTLSAEL